MISSDISDTPFWPFVDADWESCPWSNGSSINSPGGWFQYEHTQALRKMLCFLLAHYFDTSWPRIVIFVQVFMLTGLTKLRLSDNEIGIIPPEIACLENLRHLILDRNKVSAHSDDFDWAKCLAQKEDLFFLMLIFSADWRSSGRIGSLRPGISSFF